jgi:formylglycine-generating enzyme required for sulfatase activity
MENPNVKRVAPWVAALCIGALAVSGCGIKYAVPAAAPGSESLPQSAAAAPSREPDSTIAGAGTAAGDRMEITLPGDAKMSFRWCPPGTFTMGSPAGEAGRREVENQVQVRLSRGFWMAETEVTQAQYLVVMGTDPSEFKGDNMPAERVSWYDAFDFCDALSSSSGLSISLPTEAQWEYACRAGTTSPFQFGDTIRSQQVNFDGYHPYGTSAMGERLCKTTLVGSFPPNAWGLNDTHGNVHEWCSDWYGASLPEEPGTTEPGRYWVRVVRGGSWLSPAERCRSASRSSTDPNYRGGDIGFRVVLSVE